MIDGCGDIAEIPKFQTVTNMRFGFSAISPQSSIVDRNGRGFYPFSALGTKSSELPSESA